MAKRPAAGIGVAAVDIAAVDAAFAIAARAVCADHLELALRIRERVGPDRWTLEWHLPAWLGGAIGADPETCHQLTVSNVLGLASIRLADDLADGAVPLDEREAAPVVARALRGAALDFYRRTFAAESGLWPRAEAWLAQTDAGALDSHGPAGGVRLGSRGEAALLAQRAAALKLPALALTMLTRRADVFPVLERSLEHGLAAMVLYDHFTDWDDDLSAARWNAFVAHMAPPGQAGAVSGRPAILQALLVGDRTQGYFERCAAHLRIAIAGAHAVGIDELADHLAVLARQIDDHGRAVAEQYATLARQATDLFLGAAPSRSAVAA